MIILIYPFSQFLFFTVFHQDVYWNQNKRNNSMKRLKGAESINFKETNISLLTNGILISIMAIVLLHASQRKKKEKKNRSNAIKIRGLLNLKRNENTLR
jgi:Ca2+/H+ antiporter